MKTYIMIMAGGVGSRFWPKSTEAFPKQFIDILGTGESLLQMTVNRFAGKYGMENLFVLTHQNYKDLVAQQLPELSVDHILLEPSRNNTAPCIAYAGYKIQNLDPEATMVVVPSDHLILKEAVYLEKIAQAVDFVQQQPAIVTLGIQPTRPDTGYGYIHFEEGEAIKKVKAFKEKPQKEIAEAYVQSGEYLWNAGMFIWKVDTLIQALKQHAPEVDAVLAAGADRYNTEAESEFLAQHYAQCPNISIDYAVMEKADNVYTLPADIGWSDLGTWASLHAILPKDEQENAGASGSVMLDAGNNMVHLPQGKKALIKGLNDFIVVDDEEVLLIYPKNQEQSIKEDSKRLLGLYNQ